VAENENQVVNIIRMILNKTITKRSGHDHQNRWSASQDRVVNMNQIIQLALESQDGLQHENRAEVLEYNMCFGNKKELVSQFNDVRTLRPNLSKPVMHISLSLDPEDLFTKEKLRQIGQGFAKEFGFENNQYIAIYHKDTEHPHLHIVNY
ncbi:MAG: relaxase/mobilization nuclease domain-containing protein, partial [Sediminibacterium sp.]|nr:relaxase/mobilization nuclease domain-containing protein [Sediminibacterium sp.]